MFFQSVRNLLDKGIDDKLSTIKGKVREALQGGRGSLVLSGAKERRYILTFSNGIPPIPPPLPNVPNNPNLFKHYSTEYLESAFAFIFEDIQEPVPTLNTMVSEALPVLNEGEPRDGLHPFDFNLVEFQQRRSETLPLTVQPHFLHGVQHPIMNYNDTPHSNKVLSLDQFLASGSLSHLTYLCLQDIKLVGKTKRTFFKCLIQTPNIETLILRNLNLGSIQKANLPGLRFCDLSNNKLRSIASFRKIVKFSTKLEVLDLTGNPLTVKSEEVYLYKLSAAFPQLDTLNKRAILIEDRLRAIMLHGPSHRKSGIERIRWELHLDQLPEVRQFRNVEPGWKPHLIQRLVLNNVQLQFFYVGNMANLKQLDLSNNLLQTLMGAGLEKCDHLLFLNLNNNMISAGGPGNPHFLSVIPLMPSIQCIKMDGNPKVVNYRQQLIYLARNAKGNNRTIGLLQVDEAAVSRDEKVAAVEQHEPGNKEASSSYLWKLLLIEKYGHKQLQTIPGFLSYVNCLNLAKSNIVQCDVRAFENLEILDLALNKLQHLHGVHALRALRILNVRENPALDMPELLGQLVGLENLESIMVGVSDAAHERHPTKSAYRRAVLKATLVKNRKLILLDNNPISFDERVQAYHDSGFPADVVEKYRYLLALTVNCTLPFNRGIYPDQVEPIGKQYDPLSITSLLRLRNWSLTSSAVSLSYFENVTEIDLSGNRLTDILAIGLQSLPRLAKLSLHNNQIQNQLVVIAPMLDGMPSLEMVSLRGNPVMMSPVDRLTLIGFMSTMKSLTQTLKVIDTEVTIYDKVEGWKQVGGALRDAELFKLSYITHFKEYNIYHPALVNLELGDCALEYLDLSPLVNLQTLLLPNNRFNIMVNLHAIDSLTQLFAIDLRNNQFPSMSDVATKLQTLPTLRVIGASGNPFANLGTKSSNSSVTYRTMFLSLIPGLYKQHLFPLSILDTKEITPEDILEASVYSGTSAPTPNKNEFLFHISMLRRASSVPFELLTELDLSNCKLTHLVLKSLKSLVVLSLSDNLITDHHLKESGITFLYELKALDLRNNQLKELSALCKVIDLLNIESLFIEENHCFDKDTLKNRQRFFKKCTNSRTLTTLKYLNGDQITGIDTEKFGKKRK